MRQQDSDTWGVLIEKTNLIKLRIHALIRQANEFLEGQLKEIELEKRSKQWLIDSIRDTKDELSIKKAIREYSNHQWKLPELVGNRIKDLSIIIPKGDIFFSEVIEFSSNVRTRLKNKSSSETKNIAQLSFQERKERNEQSDRQEREEVIKLGLMYLTASMDAINWFERTLEKTLLDNNISIKSYSSAPVLVSSTFKKFESLAYLLAYSGVRFVTYGPTFQRKKQNKWCRICFRRTQLGCNFCHIHGTDNEFKNEFRFGEKVRKVMLEQDPTIIEQWEIHKKNIIEIEISERELNRSAFPPHEDWKSLLIVFINEYPTLVDNLPIEVIRSQNNWLTIVEILKEKFENNNEESLNIVSVASWLKMACDWMKIESLFELSDTKSKSIERPRAYKTVSRSPISSMPMSTMIRNICIENHGIREDEIAQILAVTEQHVNQQINTNKEELLIYFPWRQ